MKIIINDQEGNQHTIMLYAHEGEVKVSGWETRGEYANGGITSPTKYLKNNHAEEGEDEWVFDVEDNKKAVVVNDSNRHLVKEVS